jgi:hypothetical protein
MTQVAPPILHKHRLMKMKSCRIPSLGFRQAIPSPNARR